MRINVLPSEIANMIAAGEVVERPSSVVKELAENSIDAGAKNITIEIKKGGMTFIRISDDGCGIEPDQAETAFLRHATSKISGKDDLNSIFTLGFRGEALASIAAVSRVEMFTKTKDNPFGCFSVLEIDVFAEVFKKKKVDGKWVDSDETELILKAEFADSTPGTKKSAAR